MNTARSLLLVALIAASAFTTLAFAPPSRQLNRQQSARFALEVVEEEDPFDNYQATEETKSIAFKDFKIGDGYMVGEQPEQQLTIAYTATFLEPNAGAKFDFSKNFVCKTGQNKILPGFEEGLKVRFWIDQAAVVHISGIGGCSSRHTVVRRSCHYFLIHIVDLFLSKIIFCLGFIALLLSLGHNQYLLRHNYCSILRE